MKEVTITLDEKSLREEKDPGYYFLQEEGGCELYLLVIPKKSKCTSVSISRYDKE